MIRLRSITLSRGGINLLEQADASISDGECIALIGANGSGKSTLLAALQGDAILDAGDLDLPSGRIQVLSQAIPAGGQLAWRYVADGFESLVDVEQRMADSAHLSGEQIAELNHQWLELGGDNAHARICETLAGLGFSDEQMNAPVDGLSGGWRMRLNLARAMFVPSELLLLDEPTNHLDLDAILWLERWLIRYPGTVIVVSHDRDFLDRVADATLSIEQRKLVRYKGGYSDAERARGERLRLQSQQAAQQERRIGELNRFIERFRAKATKARQVQSRIKAIERMAEVVRYRPDQVTQFEFASVEDAPDPLMIADDLTVGYGSTVVLADIRLVLNKGARLGVLGRNGAGKSTLIRTLVGELAPLFGELQRAGALQVGYFAQTAVESLAADDTPLVWLRRQWPELSEVELRSKLGTFGFPGEFALRGIGTLSGGEKARLVLGAIVLRKPHLLVLDEPTNHLDGQTRDALGEALANYEGALLLVSHDRYLLRATVDQFLLVHAGRVDEFDGDLDDYTQWLLRGGPVNTAAATASNTTTATPTMAASVSRKDDRRAQAERRKRLADLLRPIERELAETEKKLTLIEQTLAPIETELASPLLYQSGNSTRITALGQQRGRLLAEREAAEQRWLELSEDKDRVTRDATIE